MTLQSELTNMKAKVLKRIAEAANASETRAIGRLSDVLKDIEADERSLSSIRERLTSYEETLDPPVVGTANPSNAAPLSPQPTQGTPVPREDAELSPKEWARRLRSALTVEFKLVREKGTIFRTQSGRRVGIAAANERKADNWFLGLPDTDYDEVALFCQPAEGGIMMFGIEKPALGSLWHLLSRSGGQVKFNINRRGDRYELQRVGRPPLDLGPFLDNRGSLS